MAKELCELQRCASICGTPHEQLLELAKSNDVQALETLINENEDVLESMYECKRNILQKLLHNYSEEINENTVEKLLELGVDIFHHDEAHESMETLHHATMTLKPNLLTPICNHIKANRPEKINALCDGKNTALLLLIKRGKYNDNTENFLQCVRELLLAGIDVNQVDVKNVTTIHWAAHKGYKQLVNLLLKQPNIDIDTHKRNGKSARDLIKEKRLNDRQLPETANNNITFSMKEDCMRLLHLGKGHEFREAYSLNPQRDPNYQDGICNYLQKACEVNSRNCVEFLLSKGADVNGTGESNKKLPIAIAAEKGCYDTFVLLLHEPNVYVPNEVLQYLLLYIDNTSRDYEKCLDELLRSNKVQIDVNCQNVEGYTPLHYASLCNRQDVCLKLLRHGANLAVKNHFQVMPVELVEANVLRKHLNDCIIPKGSNSVNPESPTRPDKEYVVLYDYSSLVAPIAPNQRTEKDVEIAGTRYDFPTLSNYDDRSPKLETDLVAYLAKNKETRSLLSHPVLASFLLMKWHKLCWFFYVNFIFYSIFCASLYAYIFLNYIQENYHVQGDGIRVSTNIASVILYFTFILLILRESFQLLVSPKIYVRDVENYIEVALIVSTLVMLSVNSPQKQLSAVIILLSAFELIMLMGQMPALSTNIVMLRTVSWNFFKCLSWYAILIVAFALSFFILFHENGQMSHDCKNGTKTEDDEEENDFFENPGSSLFKTIVMLTGEFDATSIKFCNFPYTSRIIFVTFVFMIAIVLINLLNGLAVSDIQMIKSDAELHGLVARAEHVHYIERMMFGDILPRNFLALLEESCCCLPIWSRASCSIGPLFDKTMLMPQLPDHRLEVNLSQQGKVCNKKTPMFNCFNVFLDRDTIIRTRDIIDAEKAEVEEQNKEEANRKRLEEIFEQQRHIKALLMDLTAKINALTN